MIENAHNKPNPERILDGFHVVDPGLRYVPGMCFQSKPGAGPTDFYFVMDQDPSGTRYPVFFPRYLWLFIKDHGPADNIAQRRNVTSSTDYQRVMIERNAEEFGRDLCSAIEKRAWGLGVGIADPGLNTALALLGIETPESWHTVSCAALDGSITEGGTSDMYTDTPAETETPRRDLSFSESPLELLDKAQDLLKQAEALTLVMMNEHENADPQAGPRVGAICSISEGVAVLHANLDLLAELAGRFELTEEQIAALARNSENIREAADEILKYLGGK